MDSVETYIQLVKQLLHDYASIFVSNEANIDYQVISIRSIIGTCFSL